MQTLQFIRTGDNIGETIEGAPSWIGNLFEKNPQKTVSAQYNKALKALSKAKVFFLFLSLQYHWIPH